MSELVFRTSEYLGSDIIEEAIETNEFITIEDYKISGDRLSFIPHWDEALEDKFDVCKFAIHMGKKLRVAFVEMVE